MAKITSTGISALRKHMDDTTADPVKNAAGVVFVAVNRQGQSIFEHASGTAGLGIDVPMTLDHSFWIASCTKMITGIACMQLVEQGILALDDVELVERLCPELKEVKVIQGKKLVPKKRGITLRMLLSHTAGFGYSFFDKRLNDFYGAVGLNEFSGLKHDYLSQPLVNQPGEAWEYGINVDWAGICLERASGMSLNDYFQKNIFEPIGITQITMFPSEGMKAKLAYMHSRDLHTGDLKLAVDGHINHAPLVATTQAERDAIFQQGGAGCFAQPSQYAQLISVLLNDGVHAPTNTRLLKKETVETMFTNQIPEFPDFARQAIVPPKPEYSNVLPELYPEAHDIPQGWGLTFFLHLRDSAVHSKGTAWWAGLPNLFWWADRSRGVGGMIATQIIPFGDPKILGLWATMEATINANLES
ncbi:uncharacterized protein Z519_10684 [Cladophialophora bantiana CBS 173.52]|uniref:Beta-lactamase-related domain-containing protein n=1 Tax=Cladophialophora bantiana (strain ATCC 10958 / CBS 173.52 / CDC B-1940 / NIH 8579) TaxID=1442370 RepID=A0A0D2H5Q7_CLAB1|nr:uncharacterized protein Z519_10684 [Cladophialophora bantiana CBS 173.52]KIW88638.1 hypothetical protein Z519_10684 [Cladophialophora bantiana CBS 173.52]